MNTNKTLDYIFDYIEYLCINKDFKTVDAILSNLHLHSYSLDEMLAYLTITLPFKKQLLNRENFYYKVKTFVEDENILSGLL
jgi:hypothetical protein